MGDGAQQAAQRGVMLALGIVLLWAGGAFLFVSFMSGKTSPLIVGQDQKGNAVGPRDASELTVRLAETVQAAEKSGDQVYRDRENPVTPSAGEAS